ncbi:MAG TPA: TIGR03016 family PEP-CTERM system-associated outer membrane protein, partial [Rhodoferax sp.]|nr:TIGR03016 family PEP-CTERM system-associated outer membrane protein [Rhodoferax sp.]
MTALFLSASGVCAQTVSVVPRISVSETLTDNVNLSSVDPQSEQITTISPGLNISINGARLKTYFDYALNHVNYAQDTSATENQNALTTFGSFEAVENRVFVDFAGSITQQAISPFGTQSNNDAAVNDNRTEYTSYSVTPYLRGQFGNNATYEARYSYAASDSDASASTTNITSSVNLSNASAFG